MTTYTSPDGFRLVEDRSMQIGSPGQRLGDVVGHPIDIYRRRFPGWTDALTDLQILELWYTYEVDRRLNAAGLHATPRTTWARLVERGAVKPDAMLEHRLRWAYGLVVNDPAAFVKVSPA